MPARALELHLLIGKGDHVALGEALDGFAQAATDDTTKARFHSLAALSWSRSQANSGAARAALTQAAHAGVTPRTSSRLARLCSVLAGDPHWQREAIERLIKTAPAQERTGAWLELARSAWLRADAAAASAALSKLAEQPEGAWLAAILEAYPPMAPRTGDETNSDVESSAAALLHLADVTESAISVALRQVVALRHHRRGKLEEAQAILEALHRDHPEDVTVATHLAHVQRELGDGAAAAAILGTTGEAVSTPEVAAALQLQAGILSWLAGGRAQAVGYFESANTLAPSAASGLLHWALRAAEPDSPDARRKALEAAVESNGDVDVYALERFALCAGSSATVSDATKGLDAADAVSLSESGDAVQLARALWQPSAQHGASLRHLANASKEGAEIAHAVHFAQLRSQSQPKADQLRTAAIAWSEAGSLSGALEWFATAVSNRQPNDELTARRVIAEHLDGPARAALDAGTALFEFTALGHTPTLLESPEAPARLADLETSPPGCDPRRRSKALAGAAELLGDEQEVLALMLCGYNELVAQRYEDALSTFRAVVSNAPDDVPAWEGLRLAAQHQEQRRTEADACSKLGELSNNPLIAARYFREAATLLLDELHDEPAGNAALGKATELDISHKATFKRWYKVLQARRDDRAIIDLLARRIETSNDVNELLALYWDRARAYRSLGQLDDALTELQNLTILESDHVGAHAMRAEIYIRQEAFDQAATQLATLAAMPAAPQEQRLMSGVAAVDLYETKLDDLSKALQVLDSLQQLQDVDTLAVRERLARATAKAGRWEDAARLLEQLLHQRQTAAGRIESARLLLAIYRDELDQPERAKVACDVLLKEAPTDAEALDFVLEDVFNERTTVGLLERARTALLAAPQEDLSEEQIARIARIAERLDDLPLRQTCLGALVTLGVNNQALRDELDELDARSEPHPQVVLGDLDSCGLLHPADRGPLSELLQLLAPHLPEALGPSLKTLNVSRAQRLKPPLGAALRSELAAVAGAFGLGDFELYVGGNEPNAIVAVAHPKIPAFVLGQNISLPLSAEQRIALMQQVFGLRRGSGFLLDRDEAEGAALVAAACKLCKTPLPGPSFAMQGEFERALERHLPRRVRKDMTPIAASAAAANLLPLPWVKAAKGSLDRAGALAVGDVSWLTLTRRQRESQERSFDAETEERLWSLLRFVLSTAFARLRDQLGMAPR